ncbi:MAG: transposase, partial [Sedimentisphaerales bacterium]|nr:transposase [Sedimentisphaerales bacterium]
QRVSTTDPDARLGKKYGHTTLGYKDHRVVDDRCGIITATLTTPANVNDEKLLPEAMEAHQSHTATSVQTVVADKAYGVIDNYRYLQEEGITPCISHKRHPNIHPELFDRDRFGYDSRKDVYLCPAGHGLRRRGSGAEVETQVYGIDRSVCEACPYLTQCVHSDTQGRTISRKAGTEAMEWADACLSRVERKRLLARRKARAEGSFADAANQHGFKRARWRGLVKMTMQNLMIAAVQNLRKRMRYAGLSGVPSVGRVPGLFLGRVFAPFFG